MTVTLASSAGASAPPVGDTAADIIAEVVSWPELLRRRPGALASPGLPPVFTPRRSLGVAGDEAPWSALRLRDAVFGRIGVLHDGLLVVDDAHYMPLGWHQEPWLPFTMRPDGKAQIPLERTGHLPGRHLYVDVLNGCRSWGHFLHDSLTYALVQGALADAGVPATAIVPDWPFPSMRVLSDRLFGAVQEVPSGWWSAEELLLAPRQWRLDDESVRVPTRALRAIVDAVPEVAELRRRRAAGPPVQIVREWGRFGKDIPDQSRHFTNGPELDAMLREMGFLPIDPEGTDLLTVISAVAEAPLVAGLHGSGMNHSLWLPRGGHCLEFTGPQGANQANHMMLEVMGIPWHEVRAVDTPEGPTIPLDRVREKIERLLRR